MMQATEVKPSIDHTELTALQTLRNSMIRGEHITVRALMSLLGYLSPRSASLLIDGLTKKGFIRKHHMRRTMTSLHARNKSLSNGYHTITVDVPILAFDEQFPHAINTHAESIPVADNLLDLTRTYFVYPSPNGWLLADRLAGPQNGDTVICRINDEVCVKLWHKTKDVVLLKSTEHPVVMPLDYSPLGVVTRILPDLGVSA